MHKSKRMISILLVLVMLISVMPMAVFAEGGLTMRISSATAAAGSTVKVKLSLENNPGISSINVKVSYDDCLTLTDVEFNPELGGQATPPQTLTSPVTLSWVRPTTGDFFGDAVFATLTFSVKSGISNKTANITAVYEKGNIYNAELEDIPMTIVGGKVQIVQVIAGDINGDGVVNQKDLTRLAQYFADWDVYVNEPTLDVNGDGSVNQKDLTRLAQYFADWDVVIYPLPTPNDCEHTSLTMHPAVAATCVSTGNTIYWQCDACGRYFSDETGDTEIALSETVTQKDSANHPEDKIIIIPAVEPTSTTEGSTEGSMCDACKKYINEPQPIPITEDSYVIVYNISGSDSYLASFAINNPNPTTYTGKKDIILDSITITETEEKSEWIKTENGWELNTIDAEVEKTLIEFGYDFNGWKDSSGKKIDIIEKGTNKNIVLSADITPHEYTIQYDTNSMLTSSIGDSTYTTNKAKKLPSLKTASYTFIGWTDQNGIFYEENSIPKGTVGDLILTSNWVSMRNRPVTYSQPKSLSIIELEEEGVILFPYEIGYIENIPLYEIMNFGNSSPIEVTQEEAYSYSIDRTQAQEISNTVSNTISNKRSYTLASDWSNDFQISKVQKEGTTEEDYKAYVYETSKYGNMSLSNSNGRETVTTDNLDWSVKASIGTNRTKNTFSPAGLITNALGIEASIEGGVSGGTETTDKTTWNHESSYEAGESESSKSETSSKLIKEIQEEIGLCEGWKIGGSETEENVAEEQVSNENEYSTTTGVKITTEVSKTKKFTDKRAADDNSYYRLVVSGTVYVFAVVVYDIAENTYSIYTYNVLDNDTSEYFDRSTTSSYNDYESIGKLAFSVPYSVHEYVKENVYGSEGLVVDKETGIIEEYTGSDADVIIPNYLSVPDGNGDYVAVRVKGLKTGLFKNNTQIRSVSLPDNITVIPEEAFSGCTSLESVNLDSITMIGKNAFNNCTSLKSLTISDKVTILGEKAFNGVKNIAVKAANADVVLFAASSGAKSISIDFGSITASDLNGKEIVVPNSTEYFEFSGAKKEFSGLSINSDASLTTEVKNASFIDSSKTTLRISSPNVTLNSVTVNGSLPAMILDAESIALKINGNVFLTTSGENAALIKNATISKYQASVSSKLSVTGNVISCALSDPNKIMSFTKTGYAIKTVNNDEFERLLTSCKVIFDPNGGTMPEADKTKSVVFGDKLGTLPDAPSRECYTFVGWFDAAEGGTQYTADTPINKDTKLYAHWTLNVYQISFNTNGGSVTEETRNVSHGSAISELPTPTSEHYNFVGWYTAQNSGEQISADTIITGEKEYFAHWTPKTYTYTVLYRSVNGTNLGSSSVSGAYGTSNTISPPGKSGYYTPASQTVAFDAASKTVTFTYGVVPQSTTQGASSGWWWNSYGDTGVSYSAEIQWQNRTASSVQVRVVWHQSIKSAAFGYNQWFYASCGGQNTGNVKIASTWTWPYYGSSGPWHTGSVTESSGWMTVPVSATDTSVTVYCDWWTEQQSSSGSWTKTISIPTY